MATKMKLNRLLFIALVGLSTECYGQLSGAGKAIKQIFRKEAKTLSKSGVRNIGKKESKVIYNELRSISSLSRRDIEIYAQELRSSNEFKNIYISPDLLEDIKIFCERSRDPKIIDIKNILKELNKYSRDVLIQERNYLRNNISSLSVEQINYYKDLNRVYPKEGNILYLSHLPSRVTLTHPLPDCISLDKWFHIAVKHGTKRYGGHDTYFKPSIFQNITKEIPDIVKKPSIPVKKSGDRFLFAKEYTQTVGFDKHEKELRKIIVVMSKDGKVITSYPIPDSYWEIIMKMPDAKL